jgi:hypothetical protein
MLFGCREVRMKLNDVVTLSNLKTFDMSKDIRAGGPGSGPRPGESKIFRPGTDQTFSLTSYTPDLSVVKSFVSAYKSAVRGDRSAVRGGHGGFVNWNPGVKVIQSNPSPSSTSFVGSGHTYDFQGHRFSVVRSANGKGPFGIHHSITHEGPNSATTDVLGSKTPDVKTDAVMQEFYGPISPIPNSHPPSLKNPQRVKQDLPTDGWHKNDSKFKKRRAKKDTKEILKRLQRQPGKPEFARTAAMPVYPGAIG